jgi:nicotinate-nucleotide adenylyltransferase
LSERRIGVLGGTFDPPHFGHLILADFAMQALKLDQVLFVPAGNPPHKPDLTRSSAEARLAMLACALPDDPRYSISRVDLDRPGPHYTLDMLRLLQAEHPTATLYFIMGGDSFRDLPQWNRPNELIAACELVIMQRPNVDIHPDMHASLIPNLAARSTFIDAPLIGISSTDIVRWLNEGQSLRYLLPAPVLEYIHHHGLYR